MAGIFTEVDSDIQKLRALKNEINAVKNQLKSIDIRVNLDIKEALEARIQSLTKQYHDLAEKVVQTEGRIIRSTQNIIEATKKITDAQEKMAKMSAPGASQQSGGSQPVATQAVIIQNSAIQAQARAYDELKGQIDVVLGTRGQNIKRMLEEQNAIRIINAEITRINKTKGEHGVLSAAQKQRLEQLNSSLLTHKAALSEVRQALSNNVKLDNAAMTSMNGLSQSLSRMRVAYRELTEEERGSTFGKELLRSIQQADAKLKELDATIGNHQRNVGNYASGWNGLSMSIQQIGREMPALAYGPKVFFSAISNNLPILSDEIKRARNEYEMLKKSGQSAVPVWKQIVSSLFSWQSALTVGITLLTLYGDKLVDWASGLFKAKEALSETYMETEKFQKSVSQSVGKVLTTIEKLSKAWIKLGDDIKSKEKFILDYKSELDSTGIAINNVADAENLLSKNKDDFIDAIIEKAKATAVMDLAAKEYEKYIQKMLEADAKAEKGVSFGDKFKSWMARSAAGNDLSGTLQNADLSPETFAKEKENKLRKEAEKHKTSMLDLTKKALGIDAESNEEISEAGGKSRGILVANSIEAIEADISSKREALKKVTNRKDYLKIEAEIKAEQSKLDAITGSTKQEAERLRKGNEKYHFLLDKQKLEQFRKAQDLENLLEQSEINRMDDRAERAVRQRELNNKKEIQAIERQKEDYINAIIQDEKDKFDAEEDIKASKDKNYKKKTFNASSVSVDASHFDTIISNTKFAQERKFGDELLKQYQSYTDERLSIEKKFNDDIILLQEARKKAAANGNTDEISKIDRSIAKATADKGKALMKHDFGILKQSPEYIRAFEDLRNTSSETLSSLLEQLENAKDTAASVLNPEDLREYTTTIQDIMDELERRNPFQSLADRQRELAEAERELAEAKRQLDAVMNGAKIVTGIKSTKLGADGLINIENTYLSAEDALKKYNKAKDKAYKSNNNFIKAEKRAKKSVDELANAIKSIGDSIGGQSGEIISLIGDVSLFASKSIDGITMVAKTGAEAMSAVEKASVILGIVSAGIQLLQKLNSLLPTAESRYEEFAAKVAEINKLTDAVNEYRIAAIEARHAEEGWFSENNLKGLRDYREVHDEIFKAYKDKANERQAVYQNKKGGGWLTGSLGYGLLGGIDAIFGTNILGNKYNENTVEAIKNLRIETRKRSRGLLGSGLFGRDQKTEDLVSWARNNGFGELFGKDNLINKDAAKAIIDKYGDKLVGQTKETLESLVKLREKYDEYIEKLHEYVNSLYEPLVDNFVDSIWTWLSDGKDALKSFREYAGDTFKDIANDMLKSIVLSKIFGKGENSYQRKISKTYEDYAKKLIDEVELNRRVSELTKELMGTAEQQLPVIQGMAKNINDTMKNIAGIDLVNGSFSQESTRKGFETMTQDQAGELNGRFTALQVTGEEVLTQSVLTNEWLAKIHAKMVAPNIPDIAAQSREIINSSYQPNIRINFPTEEFRILSDRLASVERVVTDMRDLQVERSLDTHEIGSGVQIIAKNSPMILNAAEDIKRNTSKL